MSRFYVILYSSINKYSDSLRLFVKYNYNIIHVNIYKHFRVTTDGHRILVSCSCGCPSPESSRDCEVSRRSHRTGSSER